jgi:segregation and condensation protein B
MAKRKKSNNSPEANSEHEPSIQEIEAESFPTEKTVVTSPDEGAILSTLPDEGASMVPLSDDDTVKAELPTDLAPDPEDLATYERGIPNPETPADADWSTSLEEPIPTPDSDSEFAASWSDASVNAVEEGTTSAESLTSSENPPIEADAVEGSFEAPLEDSRLESILESLLFASDHALGVTELKKLLGERDGKKITATLDALITRHKGTGIEVVRLSTGWHLRTSAENAPWVSKLLQGKPMRLSRAMMETLSIVAYRQPVTRPEVDDIRGVDCGPVLKTLLERGLIRVIGKKEEVGRPMLYGTTPEFLRVFNLRDLSELPTLREFYDLSAENQSRVEAEHGEPPSAVSSKPEVHVGFVSRSDLPSEPEENDPLIEELEAASRLAKKALGDSQQPILDDEDKSEPVTDPNSPIVES